MSPSFKNRIVTNSCRVSYQEDKGENTIFILYKQEYLAKYIIIIILTRGIFKRLNKYFCELPRQR